MLSKQVAVAETLATSRALQADDLVTFRQEAERAASGLSGAWIVLSDEKGQQLINLLKPDGTPLPFGNPVAIEFQRRALETGLIQVSDVYQSVILKTPVVSVDVPVRRPDKPPLVLSVIMDPGIFVPLFEERNLPEGWLAGLIDRHGNFVARSRDHERTVGKPASAGFRDAARDSREGWQEMLSLEGGTIANSHVTSQLSGWVTGLAADKELFDAPIRNLVLLAGLAGGVATLLSILLAIWAARQIARPIEQIELGTRALEQRKPIALPPTGVPEVDSALDAFNSTAEALERNEKERDEREAHVRLIMRELSHRSKNLLAIVLAIARQTARHTTNFRDFEARFNSRIQALADAHDLLVEQQWGGALLENLVNAQLSAFGMEKVSCRGVPVMLRAEAVQNVALALHELATNASKYGSLSVPEGRVAIDWAFQDDADAGRSLRLVWRETGGPPVSPPSEKGFGCFVLERVTINALGEGQLEFKESGLVWTCIIRSEHLVDGGEEKGEVRALRGADDAARRRAS
jgi:two-component sensor histidine kinase